MREEVRRAKAARTAKHGPLVASSVPLVAAKVRTVVGQPHDMCALEAAPTAGSETWDVWDYVVVWEAEEEEL
jgi:hypothetical protein